MIDEAIIDRIVEKVKRFETPNPNGESVPTLRNELKQVMQDHCGVFRNKEILQQGVEKVEQLLKHMANIKLDDHNQIFNTAS